MSYTQRLALARYSITYEVSNDATDHYFLFTGNGLSNGGYIFTPLLCYFFAPLLRYSVSPPLSNFCSVPLHL